MNLIEQLKQFQGDLTDQQFANKLGIHRVSWQRIKNQRVPISDKFLVRVHRAFPGINIFQQDDWAIILPKIEVPTITQTLTKKASEPFSGGLMRKLVSKILSLVKSK